MLSIALALLTSAAAADRYVATDGTDVANDCRVSTRPCETVEHALWQMDPGETVHLGEGTWTDTAASYPIVVPAGIRVKGAGADATVITSSKATTIELRGGPGATELEGVTVR